MISEKHKHPVSWVRPIAEYGPIVVFFAVYWFYGIFPATASIMAATCVAIPLSYFVERRIPILSLITAVIVGVFGGLTLWLQDETPLHPSRGWKRMGQRWLDVPLWLRLRGP